MYNFLNIQNKEKRKITLKKYITSRFYKIAQVVALYNKAVYLNPISVNDF